MQEGRSDYMEGMMNDWKINGIYLSLVESKDRGVEVFTMQKVGGGQQ